MSKSARPGAARTGDLVGKDFAQYLMLRRLGSGGMADVYLALQPSLDRQVAIKVLKPDLADDDSYVRRLHNEAKSVAALVHPHIVQVYEVGEWQSHHFIAQEYVPGLNLKQQLAKTPGLTVSEGLRILMAVTSALEKSESLNIVHRDIKPENILLGDDGVVKVADFGLARRMHGRQQLELTQVGMTVGTPLYMSPEQIRGGNVSSASDMYSLGVTAYHLLAGHPPFDAETPLDIAMQHLSATPSSLRDKRADVPVALDRLVMRMLAKQPAGRPASFRQLHQALTEIQQELLSGAQPPPSGSAISRLLSQLVGTNRREPWARRLAIWAALAVGAGMLIGIVQRPRDPLQRRPGEQLPLVARQESARSQYFNALYQDTEQAWKSVFEYFPADAESAGGRQRYYALMAKMQLARWYIQHDQLRMAIPVCEELAGLPATDTGFVAFGLAGQVIAHYGLNEPDQARRLLPSLVEKRESLDPEIRRQVDQISTSLQKQ